MLEQCKMKSEDFEKFKKDKIDAEVLEKKKSISRMTIRSKAAKSIEKISGKEWILIQDRDLDPHASSPLIVEKFQTEVFVSLRP